MGFFNRVSSAWRAFRDSVPVHVNEARSLENPTFQVNPSQLDMIWGYGPTRSGVQINEHTAMTVVGIYAAHKIIGETVGMLPWAVYEGDEDDKQRKRAKNHSAYKILRYEPNPEMSPFTLKEVMLHHVLGWGNCYVRIVLSRGGKPIALRPLLPDRTHPERRAGKLVYHAERGDTFDAEEVLHIPGLSFDGLKGYSPISMAREAIGAGKAAEIHAATFFGNGATIGGFLEVPNNLKPEQIANMRDSFHAMHGGVGNAYKTGILHAGVKYVQGGGVEPEAAQLLETRKFSIIDIARLYRIPPHMLADLSHGNKSSVEQASLEFLIYTLSPWLTRLEDEATRKLCRDSEYYVKFDERKLLRADMTSKQQYYASGRQWGYLSANDVRLMEGELPIGPEGDVYLSPVNEQNSKVAAKQTEPTPPNSPGAGGKPGESPFGGAPANRAIAAAGSRIVFEDAITRMLRKEANAAGRGKADDGFYANHRTHVIESLTPAVRSLGALLGQEIEPDHPAILALADEKHEGLNGNIPVLAAQKAGEIIQKLTENV